MQGELIHTEADRVRTLELRAEDRLGDHPELARRLFIAVASYRAGVSYATQERRFYDSGEARVDRSWGVVADKIMSAVTEAISERLISMFE